jgi:murein L,D-transpeptidase YcbB/YkuD
MEVPLPQLDGLWTRDAVVWWPQDSSGADAGRDAAQRALKGLGFAEPDLTAAEARFQQETSLVADGRLGPRTMMAIFARSAEDRPRLSRGVERP